MSAEEGTPPAEAELRAMKVSALKKRAKEAGVGEAELEEADDADDVKSTLIALIVARERVPEPAEQLRAELAGMKPSALKKRAKEAGVEEGKLEDADDADDVKATLIELIVEKVISESPEAELEEQVKQLRKELGGMKPSALKKRAKEAGVGEAELEEADDADDVKVTLIALIVDKMREEHGAGGADSAAELEAQKQEEKLQQLREELEGMKPSALKKRAKEAGVEEGKLEDADDADDVKGTLVELIVEKAREGPPTTVVKPHFSAVDSGGSKAERLKALFGGKHCMLSYNWAVQEQVKAARTEVGAAGVPTWMDIDGEPAPSDGLPHLRPSHDTRC
eukprot:COSAG04_NODE_1165_length_7994_cov_50.104370_5_plen_337_part_00